MRVVTVVTIESQPFLFFNFKIFVPTSATLQDVAGTIIESDFANVVTVVIIESQPF